MSDLYNALQAIKEIANENSKLTKKTLLNENKDVPYVVDMLAWLINPQITSGIAKKKMDSTISKWNSDTSYTKEILDLNPKEFLDWLHINNTGVKLTIDTAYAWILNQNKIDTRIDVEMLCSFVSKSYRVGMSEKSINEAIGETIIPEWNVQLAFPYEDKLKLFKESDLFTVTQKLDGIRCIFIVRNVNNRLTAKPFTRSGKPIEGLIDLENSAKEIATKHLLNKDKFKNGVTFDGELLAINHDNLSSADLFQKTSKLIRTSGIKREIRYNTFDVTPISEFESGSFSQIYTERRTILNSITETNSLINIVPVLGVTSIDNIPYWADIASKNGWEGVMLNHNEALYKKSRTKDLLKVKEMRTADLQVVGFKQAETGAFKGLLGAIVVKLDERNLVDVGSGFTKEQRQYIWEHQDEYLNKIVEIQYFEQTTDRFGNKSLRFPVWKNIVRFDKTLDDVNLG